MDIHNNDNNNYINDDNDNNITHTNMNNNDKIEHR